MEFSRRDFVKAVGITFLGVTVVNKLDFLQPITAQAAEGTNTDYLGDFKYLSDDEIVNLIAENCVKEVRTDPRVLTEAVYMYISIGEAVDSSPKTGVYQEVTIKDYELVATASYKIRDKNTFIPVRAETLCKENIGKMVLERIGNTPLRESKVFLYPNNKPGIILIPRVLSTRPYLVEM